MKNSNSYKSLIELINTLNSKTKEIINLLDEERFQHKGAIKCSIANASKSLNEALEFILISESVYDPSKAIRLLAEEQSRTFSCQNIDSKDTCSKFFGPKKSCQPPDLI